MDRFGFDSNRNAVQTRIHNSIPNHNLDRSYRQSEPDLRGLRIFCIAPFLLQMSRPPCASPAFLRPSPGQGRRPFDRLKLNPRRVMRSALPSTYAIPPRKASGNEGATGCPAAPTWISVQDPTPQYPCGRNPLHLFAFRPEYPFTSGFRSSAMW